MKIIYEGTFQRSTENRGAWINEKLSEIGVPMGWGMLVLDMRQKVSIQYGTSRRRDDPTPEMPRLRIVYAFPQ